MKAKKNRLDIFKVLERIDLQDKTFYTKLSKEDKKLFVPIVVMQWLSCSNNVSQNILLNEIVNKNIFTLYKHPELLYKLMTICTNGKKNFYKWKKPANKNINFPLSINIIKESLGYSTKNAIQSLPSLKNDDILEIARDLAYDDTKIKDLKKELNLRG
jgi:hypothetical protein